MRVWLSPGSLEEVGDVEVVTLVEGHLTRRRGLGRAVVQACLNAAQEQDVKVVNLSTTAMARPLYESLGFQASPAEMRLKLP